MRTRTSLLLFSLLAIASPGCGGPGDPTPQPGSDDDSMRMPSAEDAPFLDTGGALFTFPAARTGTSESIELTLTAKNGPVRITRIALEEDDATPELSMGRGFGMGAFELAQDASHLVEVVVTPSDREPDAGRVLVDAIAGRSIVNLALELRAPVSGKRVSFPERISVELPEPGEQLGQILTLSNDGDEPLSLQSISVGDPTGSFVARFPQGDDPVPTSQAFTPTLVAPGADYLVGLDFTAYSRGRVSATLTIVSDDTEEPSREVPLVAQRTLPCLVMTTESGEELVRTSSDPLVYGYTFPPLPFDVATPQTDDVVLLNCSHTRDVVLTGAVTQFDEGLSTTQLDLSAPRPLPPQGRLEFGIGLDIAAERDYAGTLTVQHDIDGMSPVQLQLSGRGLQENQCPESVITVVAPVQTDTTTGDVTVDMTTDDILRLRGIASGDPDGTTISYQCRFDQRPDGSTATLSPSEVVADPLPLIDLPGTYVITLEVTDQWGLATCAPASITVNVSAP